MSICSEVIADVGAGDLEVHVAEMISSPRMSDSTAKREPFEDEAMAIPAVGRFKERPHPSSASEAPQTEAIDDDRSDSVISETTRTV